MPALIDIRRRIRSVKNTQQITKAMKMVSAAKLRRAQEAMFAARPYARKMMEVLSSMAARAEQTAHPLLEQREGELYAFLDTRHPALLKNIAEKKDLKGELTDTLKAALQEFAGLFQAGTK